MNRVRILIYEYDHHSASLDIDMQHRGSHIQKGRTMLKWNKIAGAW